MTDLHTHILPAVDDGSRNIETTIELLKMEESDGVKKIAFTPHYIYEDETPSEFLKRREEVFKSVSYDGLYLKTGAEVYFCHELFGLTDEDLLSLCLTGTNYLFLELSMGHEQDWVEDFIKKLIDLDITPVIVHIERYDYLMKNLKRLKSLIELGCLTQINCESLLRDKKETAFMKKLIKNNLVHVMATDTHSVARRPVNMKKAVEVLDDATRLINNAELIFDGKRIEILPPKLPSLFSI